MEYLMTFSFQLVNLFRKRKGYNDLSLNRQGYFQAPLTVAVFKVNVEFKMYLLIVLF